MSSRQPIIIKEIHMNAIKGIFKPAFERKLGLKAIQKVTFKANKISDELSMEGWGADSKTGMFKEVKAIPMKVSENTNYETILMRNVNKHVKDVGTWQVVYLTFDYSQGIVFTEVWYVSKAGQKNSQRFESKM